MNEWKIRQEIYHRTQGSFNDDMNNFNWILSDDIIENAIKYFKTTDIGWIWPAKSYMVGICYAKWLSVEFGGHPLDYLNDPEMLYNNDPYFVTYNESKEIYDKILERIFGWEFDENLGVVPEVKQYFNDEFLIDKMRDKNG
jgi:hypothetical protein